MVPLKRHGGERPGTLSCGTRGRWTTRGPPFLGASSRRQCPQGWGTCLGVFSTFPRGDSCERHGPSLPLTAGSRAPRQDLGSPGCSSEPRPKSKSRFSLKKAFAPPSPTKSPESPNRPS